jgi:hypothetical protein
MRVARWYCPQAQQTFSLLPDCLAARLGGSLDEVERAVVAAETAGVEAAAQALRIEQSELPGAVRWLRRRRRGVGAAVLALVTAMPGRLGNVPELRPAPGRSLPTMSRPLCRRSPSGRQGPLRRPPP